MVIDFDNYNKEYSQYFNLRPEFHPERFVIPWGRDKDKKESSFH